LDGGDAGHDGRRNGAHGRSVGAGTASEAAKKRALYFFETVDCTSIAKAPHWSKADPSFLSQLISVISFLRVVWRWRYEQKGSSTFLPAPAQGLRAALPSQKTKRGRSVRERLHQRTEESLSAERWPPHRSSRAKRRPSPNHRSLPRRPSPSRSPSRCDCSDDDLRLKFIGPRTKTPFRVWGSGAQGLGLRA